MNKIINIRRREPGTRLAKEIASDTVCKVGGCLTGTGTPLKGISFEEERKYLPKIVGLPFDHLEFTTRVDKWYNNISIDIPFAGLRIELVFDENNEPVNIREWLYWKFLQAHPSVAADRNSMYSNPNARCFIEDVDITSSNAAKNLEVERRAYVEMGKILDDENRLDIAIRQLANVHGEMVGKYTKMKFSDKQVALSEFMKKNPVKFVKAVTDPDAEIKAEVYTMIDYGILTRVGERVIYKTQPLGENIDEVVAFLKTSTNSEMYAILKGNLHALGGSIKRKALEKKETVKAEK